MEDGIGWEGRGGEICSRESRRRLLSRTDLSQGTRERKGREEGAPLTRAGRDNMTGGTKLAPRRLGLGTWMVGVGVDVLAGRKAGLAHLLSRAPGCRGLLQSLQSGLFGRHRPVACEGGAVRRRGIHEILR